MIDNDSGDDREKDTKPLPVDAHSQCMRLLAYLLTYGRITTTEAREKLDILSPASRILELRRRGHKIATHWERVYTALGRHRVAEYVLLVGGAHDA